MYALRIFANMSWVSREKYIKQRLKDPYLSEKEILDEHIKLMADHAVKSKSVWPKKVRFLQIL